MPAHDDRCLASVQIARLDNFDPLKLSLVVGDNVTSVGLSDGGHDGIHGTSRGAGCLSLCHQFSPDEIGLRRTEDDGEGCDQ